jgi:hypothetical protein
LLPLDRLVVAGSEDRNRRVTTHDLGGVSKVASCGVHAGHCWIAVTESLPITNVAQAVTPESPATGAEALATAADPVPAGAGRAATTTPAR